MKKRIISALFAAIFAFSAAACGSSVKASQEDTAAVQAAIENFAACQSFTVEQSTKSTEVANLDGEVFTYKGNNVKQMGLVIEPEFQLRSSAETTVTADEGVMEQSTLSYIMSENGQYTEYFTDGSQWYQFSSDDASLLSGINARAFAGAFFVDVLSFGKAGEDNLDAGKAVRYEGSLGGAELVAMLEGIGYFANSIGSMSENQQAKIKTNLEKDLKPVTVKLWVDNASGYPVRFEVSLTDMLKNLDESISNTLGGIDTGDFAITEYEIVMTVSDFNAVENIVLPAEAENAQVYEVQ